MPETARHYHQRMNLRPEAGLTRKEAKAPIQTGRGAQKPERPPERERKIHQPRAHPTAAEEQPCWLHENPNPAAKTTDRPPELYDRCCTSDRCGGSDPLPRHPAHPPSGFPSGIPRHLEGSTLKLNRRPSVTDVKDLRRTRPPRRASAVRCLLK